jgi:hypothetical protein
MMESSVVHKQNDSASVCTTTRHDGSSEDADRNFRFGVCMAIASRILLSALLANLPHAVEISTCEYKYKLLARGKSLSVSDFVMAGLSPNPWVESRSLFSSGTQLCSIIRITTMDRYADVSGEITI